MFPIEMMESKDSRGYVVYISIGGALRALRDPLDWVEALCNLENSILLPGCLRISVF